MQNDLEKSEIRNFKITISPRKKIYYFFSRRNLYFKIHNYVTNFGLFQVILHVSYLFSQRDSYIDRPRGKY